MITNLKPNTNVKDSLTETVVEVAYAWKNQKLTEVNSTDKDCIVKHVHTENQHMISDKYYIMAGRDGFLYNPLDTPTQRSKTLGHIGGFFSLKKTSKNAFDYYLRFLQTKNTLHYSQADKLTALGE